jgi:hypothetical protein
MSDSSQTLQVAVALQIRLPRRRVQHGALWDVVPLAPVVAGAAGAADGSG